MSCQENDICLLKLENNFSNQIKQITVIVKLLEQVN